MNRCTVFLTSLTLIVATKFSVLAQTTTNCLLPGITCFSQIQTSPPQRLFIARVDLTNPRVQLRVARGGPDPDGPGAWETTLLQPTSIANRDHFSLVVNGDFFLAKNIQDAEGANSHYRAGQWARTEGPAMTDGTTWSTGTRPRPCLVIHKNGTITIESLWRPRAHDRDVLGGGPILLRNGVVVVAPAKPHQSFRAANPRTAVGLNAGRTTLTLLVVDGRRPGIASGMTLHELASQMLRLGCTDAINLDGGGSSVMAVRNAATGAMTILNKPSDGHERAVADVLGIFLDH